MGKLSSHTAGRVQHLLYIGNSGTGKTGSLVSLVKAGYKLRIIDMDNGLESLKHQILNQCPDKIDNVEYETRRDRYRMTATGPRVQGAPKAFIEASRLIDEWPDGTKPEEWGPEYVLVIDSLTQLGRAAFEWSKALNPTYKEARLWYVGAQDAIKDVLSVVTAESFYTNVLILSHVDYKEDSQGLLKGFASSIGTALGPKLPLYFNTLILAETVGQGEKVRRQIRTVPTAQIDLKNPNPLKISATYSLNEGLAEIYRTLKG